MSETLHMRISTERGRERQRFCALMVSNLEQLLVVFRVPAHGSERVKLGL